MTVLALTRNSPRGSAHIYYALSILNAFLSSKKGIHSLLKVYKFNFAHILPSLSKHMVDEKVAGESLSFLDLSTLCLDKILKSDFQNKNGIINHCSAALIASLFHAVKRTNGSPVHAGLLYNILQILDHPVNDVLTQLNIPSSLLQIYRANPEKNALCLHILAKLVKLHTKVVSQSLGINWSNEEKKKLLLSQDFTVVKSGLQLLACWLQASQSHVSHWKTHGGFEVLLDLLRYQSKQPELNGFVIGNAALCLGECARNGTDEIYSCI